MAGVGGKGRVTVEHQGVDFFISYTGADKAWAEWIAWQLTEAGFEVLLQAWHFDAGSNFVEEMHDAAARALQTIAVLSPDFLKSEYTAPEWQAAFAADPRGQKRKLVPVRVRPCQPDGLLRTIVYIDLVGVDRNAARERLISAIQSHGPPDKEPGFPGKTPAVPPAAGSKGLEAEPSFPAAGIEFIVDCSFDEFNAREFADALLQATAVKPTLSGAQQNADGRTVVAIPSDSPDADQIIAKLRESPDAVTQLADTSAVQKIAWFRENRECVIWIPDPNERERRRDWLEDVRNDVLEHLEQITCERAVQRLARLAGVKQLEQKPDTDKGEGGAPDTDSGDEWLTRISGQLVQRPELVRKFREIRTPNQNP